MPINGNFTVYLVLLTFCYISHSLRRAYKVNRLGTNFGSDFEAIFRPIAHLLNSGPKSEKISKIIMGP